MRAAAAQSAQHGPRLHFAPGTRTEYSSTNYVLAGLVLLAHSPKAEGDWRRLSLLELAIPPARRAAYAHMRFVNDEPVRVRVRVRVRARVRVRVRVRVEV